MERATLDRYTNHKNHPDSLVKLLNHKLAKTIVDDDPEGPVHWKRKRDGSVRTYEGITRPLMRLFYPTFKGISKNRTGRSSRTIGSRVHRQLFHTIECKRRGMCLCKTKTRKLNKYTVQALDKLKELDLTPECAEIPIVSHSSRTATRIDMICTRWKGSQGLERSVIVSIKTGYHCGGFDVDKLNQILESPLAHVRSTPRNHNQLQACCELAIIREDYGESPIFFL